MVVIELPDGSKLEFQGPTTVKEIAGKIAKSLEKNAVGAVFNGELIDVHTPITESGRIRIITPKDPESLEILRHSAAHLLAKAVKKLYGNNEVKLGIGPATQEGFYYDFDLPVSISEEDLPKIEAEMEKIVKAKEPFRREVISREKARELFKNDPYKLKLLESIPEEEEVSIYWLGEDFFDLCKGPHVEHAGQIKAFKLLSVAGAYWRGDSRNKMLQRIYGTAFWKKKELEEFLHRLEEAKKRDHRVLGKQLDLFGIYEEAGPGLVFWHPNGAIIRQEIEQWVEEEHRKRGYQRIYTPHIMKADLWKRSGHYNFYRENMFFVPVVEHDEEERLGNDEVPLTCSEIEKAHWYAVKPMNCPGHILIYKSQVRSYRDLPIRFFEFGTVYRYEKSGSLHGLLRVRGFTQDDGHIFCRPDQLKEEIQGVMDYIMDLLSTFKLDYVINVGTRPEKFIGTEEAWEHATNALIEALKERGFEYNIVEGDGAFYGPKIDIAVLDAIGRKWDGPTIQVDFNLPERFDLTYVDRDGQKKRPVMVHRAIMGSIERFIGLLIEHYAGLFPTWLAPVQAVIIPVSDKYLDYADEVYAKLKEAGIRVKLDDESAKVGYKIRKAETQKIPYMLIVGEREKENQTVSVRSKREGDLGEMELQQFLDKILTEIKEKA
ncbi:threonyl-tRNA synthetase [Thermovibrio ammonificans HB-1]|uniref:Threonine--tRNA ligase n=1 Tax=Thermovibrio ammonificans (strain DSM 15698 / JCM 12110 / HB-1) TaxID=648996 RepID=E8T2P6_THEA1|nr:threonine--tRNA ligase [Thermovibrio ammonificans]ADU97141.1 threonyl-tRNA synthetase [Thermovibrio ammonificans HB-1]